MRKKVFGRQFSRSRKAREALFKSLIKAFFLHGKITTTYAKAKAIQGDIDKLVSLAKIGGVNSSRQISGKLSADRKQTAEFLKVSLSFKDRKSGFTRIVRLPKRFGDAADLARIEWVDKVEVPKAEKIVKESKPKKQVVKKVKRIKAVKKAVKKVK